MRPSGPILPMLLLLLACCSAQPVWLELDSREIHFDRDFHDHDFDGLNQTDVLRVVAAIKRAAELIKRDLAREMEVLLGAYRGGLGSFDSFDSHDSHDSLDSHDSPNSTIYNITIHNDTHTNITQVKHVNIARHISPPPSPHRLKIHSSRHNHVHAKNHTPTTLNTPSLRNQTHPHNQTHPSRPTHNQSRPVLPHPGKKLVFGARDFKFPVTELLRKRSL